MEHGTKWPGLWPKGQASGSSSLSDRTRNSDLGSNTFPTLPNFQFVSVVSSNIFEVIGWLVLLFEE